IIRGRALRLTDAGQHIQRAGKRAQHEVDRALHEVQGPYKWTELLLRVAAGSLSAATLMPRALAFLRDKDAGLRVVLIDRPVGMLGDLLLSGEADIAIGSIDSPLRLSADLRSELLLSDSLCVVCSRANALAAPEGAAKRRVRWSDLQQTELILVGRVGGQWNSLLQDQLAAHPGLRVGHEVQLLSTALELVRYDLGVAVLPRFATAHLDTGAFWTSALESQGSSWNTYWVTRKATKSKEAGADLLLEALRASIPVGGARKAGNKR
ncbi:MAG: LysR substrate-binding domain-containing protein, partial [Nitrospira sp.]